MVPSYVTLSAAAMYERQFGDVGASATFEVLNVTDALVQDNYGVQRPGRSYALKLALAF